jgi:Protein of unknown function (DUF3800)
VAGLRNEDYVAFLDESGEEGLQVVAGILVPARWLRATERRWRDFIRDELGSRSGRTEIKGRDLIKGGGVALHAQRRLLENRHAPLSAAAAGRLLYRRALEHIAGIAEIRVLVVGLSSARALEVYRLWFWMTYAALVERPRAPRPRLPAVVIDGEDVALRHAQDLVAYRFHRQCPRCQPYVAAGSGWFVGGAMLHDSRFHPLIQMADLVAGAARHSIARRSPYRDWYRRHLSDYAHMIGRDIDCSSHALAQLKRRSRHDACRSGWPDALLPD